MANPEHLARLKEGVEAWNRWRREHPEIVPDLSDAMLQGVHLPDLDLRNAILNGAKLGRANLMGADLTEADLIGAYLSGANLSGARMRAADLSNAFLTWADLTVVDLSEAILRGTHLWVARLLGTDLANSDFSGAAIGNTTFADVDLSTVRGLDSVLHRGSSTIGIDTIYKSNGRIPLEFLRGAGVPEEFLTYMAVLAGPSIEFYSCFISYSNEDQAFADQLHQSLQAHGVRAWFAPEDLKIGDKFQEQIEQSIRVFDKLIVVLSENSVNSPWVEREVRAAFEKESRSDSTVLFPVFLDDSVMEAASGWAADIRRTRHIGDFRNWKDHDSFQKSLDRLLRDLKAQDSKPKK